MSLVAAERSRYEYTVFFEPRKGGYGVMVPAIPEICTFGGTLDEARAMAADAIRCYLESALKNGEPIPKDRELHRERLTVSLRSRIPPESAPNS